MINAAENKGSEVRFDVETAWLDSTPSCPLHARLSLQFKHQPNPICLLCPPSTLYLHVSHLLFKEKKSDFRQNGEARRFPPRSYLFLTPIYCSFSLGSTGKRRRNLGFFHRLTGIQPQSPNPHNPLPSPRKLRTRN